MRLLSQHDHQQPFALMYLHRRETTFLRTFAPFGLAPTECFPTYETVQLSPKNEIRLY